MADKKMVRTTGFVTRFEVEKGLVITAEGVELTADQVDKAQKAAKSTRTVLVIDDIPAKADTTDTSATADTADEAATTETAAKSSRGGRS